MGQPDTINTQQPDTGLTQWWLGIVEAHLAPIYRFVRSRAQAGCVDDIVQETFVAAAGAAARFDPARGEVWPWLLGIARRKISDHYRQARRDNPLGAALVWLAADHDLVERAIADESPLPEEICQREEFAALARAALASLEPSHRDCLLARYYDDLSLDEIAAQRGLSRSAANSLLYRARAELRAAFLQLAGDGFAPEDGSP